eukprot:364932-Chlamydomonas_euryale.AAC.4
MGASYWLWRRYEARPGRTERARRLRRAPRFLAARCHRHGVLDGCRGCRAASVRTAADADAHVHASRRHRFCAAAALY